MSHWAESSVFPLGLIPHIIFVLIAVVYIGYRYFKYRKGYQLSLIFFVVLTLLYDSKVSLEGSVGNTVCIIGSVVEIILFVLTLVLGIKSFISASKEAKEEKAAEENKQEEKTENV